ncbi:DUF4391 domain-containing protein [Microbacterium sp. NPDC006705]|uniref:DUF4391 domain-containing protein n=1 Tax=Microbacterium sp. NPDC006705 TaxID=3364181 RepID=UPI00384CF56B
MTDILYEWPVAARFGARIPKERFYERTAGSSALREKFVSDVQRITWMYKLAPDTINLPASTEVPEIEVLWLHAKTSDVSESVLAAIDQAIPNPTLFEIHRDDTRSPLVRLAAAHKIVRAGAPRPSTYYSTGWMSAATAREAMPTAISLPTLYSALIAPLTPISAYAGEDVSVTAERLAAVRKLEREISTLERKLRNEPQLNRKVELRRELKDRQAALAALV